MCSSSIAIFKQKLQTHLFKLALLLTNERYEVGLDYQPLFGKGARAPSRVARVFYEQIVNEAQPSWLSLVENSGS